jgi:hypothetical protein
LSLLESVGKRKNQKPQAKAPAPPTGVQSEHETRNMRSSIARFILLGQAPREDQAALSKLTSTLAAMRRVGADRAILSHQLVDVMTSLQDEKRRPSRTTVESFADEFTGALIGRPLTNGQVAMLQLCITEVVRGSTTNLNSTSHLREALTTIHIDSLEMDVIIKDFLAIGEEVRGPDDFQLRRYR